MRTAILIITVLLSAAVHVNAQTKAFVSGKVTNEKGEALEAAYVYDTLSLKGISTNQKGFYELEIKPKQNIVLAYRYLGYQILYKNVVAQKGQNVNIDVSLKSKSTVFGKEIIIQDEAIRGESTNRIDAKVLESIPSTGGGVETAIIAQPGVASNNELSSQYTVRGGNFDENLVYVNDFEITRPFLIRAGQQEGLSFINSDLVGGILFSSGGFQAKYGDKMSSVLDISYKKPTHFKGSIGLGLLGYSGHIEGISNNKKLTYLLGVRYKSNAHLLNALQTEGDYKPSFLDVQSYLTYNINEKLQFAWMANVSRNRYEVIPTTATAEFGTVTEKISVDFGFDGQERDKFLSSMNGISLRYQPNNRFSAKLLTSAYLTDEKEAFDIITYYQIGDVETDPSKDEYGMVTNILGYGTFHDYARNQLNAIISNTELNLSYQLNSNNFLQAGLQYKYENIVDELKEWNRVDSAGYSRPVSTDKVLLSRYLKVDQQLKSNRASAYIQNTLTAGENSRFKATAGLRFNYWSVNKEAYVNPRLQMSFNPKGLYIFDKLVEKDIVFRASTGLHYQPPFYREMRNYEGELNYNLRSQKSWHTVVGANYKFQLGNKPFTFIAEAYYKQLWDLVPYDIDNVLIRYFGKNMAEGYAVGADFRISGQFVGDAESWFSFSLLKTQENIYGDYYYSTYRDPDTDQLIQSDTLVGIGYVNRPTDQSYNFNIFFQDHLPNNDNYKVHLNFVWGGGFAYGPPDNARYRNSLRFKSYKRADIGFSALLFDTAKKQLPDRNPFRKFQSFWITGEVLNLLGFENEISAIWVEDFSGRKYPAPNRSTSRLVNLRLIAKF